MDRSKKSGKSAVAGKRKVLKITDVARAANVSPATVSRVLNNSTAVRPEVSAKVLKVARKLGYVPFSSARSLRQLRARVWAAIVPDIENPFFTAVVRGIEEVARQAQHRLVLCNSNEDPEREAAYIEVALAERMAGVVIAVASANGSSVQPLIEHGVPVVAVDRLAGRNVNAVLCDNRLGAEEATQHLLATGSKRVACVTGPARVNTAVERVEGYLRALQKAGVAAEPDLVKRADYKESGGYEAARALLTSSRPPDALFVANNPMAAGALRALRELNLQAPRDVALVAFDDSPWCELISPRLSVVAQPAVEIGHAAAELLTDSANRTSRTIVLTPRLIVRESSHRQEI